MYLNLRTEFSYGQAFGRIKKVVEYVKNHNGKFLGIADDSSIWGFVTLEKECLKAGIKPIFGVRLNVVPDLTIKDRRNYCEQFSLIAINEEGLKYIYELTTLAQEQKYYIPRISYNQLNNTSSEDIILISQFSPHFDLLKRSCYFELSPHTPFSVRNIKQFDYIAGVNNFYIKRKNLDVYECFADERKTERKTKSSHIYTYKEWKSIFPNRNDLIEKMLNLADSCNVELPKSKNVKFNNKITLKELCISEAKKRNINIENKEYAKRFKREIELIEEKNFSDYFFIVHDLVNNAKKSMFVGPARGSSAGSLVCYMLGITEVDPIKHDLVFERFIDINRSDLPDIDIDFPDTERKSVIDYLRKKYGNDKVSLLGNISRLKPKSTLDRVAKSLCIPPWEIEEFKESIEDRADGHPRADLCILDAYQQTKIGKKFLKNYPNMIHAQEIEYHASHYSVHAAGVLVNNNALTNYTSITTDNVAMIDKLDAEYLNLLKIDILGLRTLSIIMEICNTINFNYMNLYHLPLDDKKTYKTINKQRLTGIFQFEGDSIRRLAKKMPIENIEDISVLVSICRPGPMIVGSADKYVKRRSGKANIKYISDNKIIKKITKSTYGLIIYQEQVINILRYYAKLNWETVTSLRKGMAKSKGNEFFAEYKEQFINNVIKQNISKEEAKIVWETLKAMGQYSFNKSHALSYALITYITAYLKTHYPLEFAVASLNHIKNDDSAVKLLRELRENEGIKHEYFSFKHSDTKWKVYNGKLLASITTIDGIGPKAANTFINCRKNGSSLPKGINESIHKMVTPFKYLYPAKQIYGDYYKNPKKYGVNSNIISLIKDVQIDNFDYCVIGKLVRKVFRDMNEPNLVSKRKGKRIEDENTTFISISIEDDTAKIHGLINNKDFEDIAEPLIEAKIDKEWFLLYGTYNKEFNMLYIHNIKLITIEGI